MIPLSEPWLHGNEALYVTECIRSGWVSSASPYVGRFEEAIASFTGASYAVAVSSGTAALHLSLLAAGVRAGDLVLAPNLSFVASANAVRYVGAEPVLVDADTASWQMDAGLAEVFLENECEVIDNQCIHKATCCRVGAAILTHVLGYWADADRWLELCRRFSIPLIEDAAEAIGTRHKGRHAGTIGLLGCLSFNGNKLITTGGGGMVLCADKALAQKVRHLATQAKCSPEEYIHDEVGFNYRMSGLSAAMGLAQVEQLPVLLQKRREVFDFYAKNLTFPRIDDLFPGIFPDSLPNFWLTTIKVPDSRKLVAILAQNQIQSRPLWMPMNQLPMFSECRYLSVADVSGSLYESCVSLPSSASVTVEALEEIIARIKD
ncbi:MAG: aminotransferase class I/II-fold pyridoxal phosphate-dependent enzyme [Bacteroidetes bacterium]|nr:MAG: aminotransferase class I/II-fold pyridoxal phosphate-dependent enzyme [Bacteroidota bacterium]